MRHDQKHATRNAVRRASWLATAAIVALGVSGAAWAQQNQPSSSNQGASQPQATQTQAGNPLAPQLQAVERSLRQSHEQLAQQGSSAGQPNWGQARRAVSAGLQTLGRAPSDVQGQDAFRIAQTQLSEAQSALEGDSPDRQRAAAQVREAAEAVASLYGQVTSASASGSGQSSGTSVSGGGAQVTVQQQSPQVNVQQAQPRVTVQRQGEPQVNVEREGQPQVNVQREAQANVQRQGQTATETQQQDQRTGATTTTPAPAQSGGAQRTAVSPAAGLPLREVSNLIGTNIVGVDGREAGEVENLLLDGQGSVRGALVEWGGFLGIGTRRAVVPMERIDLGSRPARLNMTREELEALPRYDEANIAAYGQERGWGEGVRMAR
ncbi:PRC-barrel domain-containing protein [Falsiroseomonas sp. E2-1-a20]|uniref:PRC-barrel domain-containing protein n=1 Tax=Falsiroseomonas sp. E2-1-a20 TaxID=3239300 RepID=UPI003F2FD249